MPTPVNSAKQCLNPEASHALDEAVCVARRRGHPQTTSLHAVSSFLSLSPSQLKEACIRARNAAFYNPKVQLKALEFCLSVSLDRLPISQPRVDEPYVSNSLMAAIKRSQANQRRHPDCIMAVKSNHGMQVGHCQDQNFGGVSSSSGVKVDLQHLILSILDDPIVSRVFNDAGFNNFDVKLAVLRPFQGLFPYSDPGFRRVRFPFAGSWDEEGEYKRVVEVLRRKKGRNPVLVGVCASEVLKGFVEVLERRKEGVLPMDLYGINVVSIEEELAKFATANLSYDAIGWRFKEVDLMVEQCLGPGLMVNVGNVRGFLGKEKEDCEMDMVNCVVRKLTKLIENHGGRVWVIGSAADDQTYMELMSRFPLIDKDWDLQPLPITSMKPSMGESCFKSSLMGSFVPFGGFFSSPPVPKGPFSSSFQCATSNVFDGKLQHDVATLSKREVVPSVADLRTDRSLEHLKAKHGAMLLSGTVAGLQRNLPMGKGQNHNLPSTKPDCFQPPISDGCRCVEQKATTLSQDSSCSTGFCFKKCDYAKINACLSRDYHDQQLVPQTSKQVHLGSFRNEKDNFLAKLSKNPSKTEHPGTDGSCSPYSLCVSGEDDGQTSPSSGVSVITDLGLELFPQASKQQKQADGDADDDCHVAKCSNNASFAGQAANNFKALFKALFDRVGRQSDALRVVSQIVSQSWVSNGSHQRSALRGDIWLNFIGPDIFGKRKTALALAEILYGNKKYFVHVNFSSEDEVVHQKKIFGYQVISAYDARSRGRTVVDHIAEELRKTPFCVVLLENVLSADPVAQQSLLQAMKNGKFSDSYGREVSTANRVFVLTSRLAEDSSTSSLKGELSMFSEARMERAKGWPLQLVVKGVGDYSTHQDSFILGLDIPNQILLSKRKLNGTHETTRQCVSVNQVKRPHKGPNTALDLNLPPEITETDNTIHGDSGGAYACKSIGSWLEELSDQVPDKTLVKVVFDPYDYDALASNVLKLVHTTWCEMTDSKRLLEIEPRVMDQIMAAACLSSSEKKVDIWIDEVLRRSFEEAQKIYQLASHSILMLVACDSEAAEQVEGFCLPSKISVK